MSNLIHKTPCPRGAFAAPTWNHSPHALIGRPCGCPSGWPKYEDDLYRAAEAAIEREREDHDRLQMVAEGGRLVMDWEALVMKAKREDNFDHGGDWQDAEEYYAQL